MPGQPWGAAVRLEQGGAAAGDGLWPDEGTGKHDVDSREQQEPLRSRNSGTTIHFGHPPCGSRQRRQ
jgi:hypothetical protein